MSDLQLGRVKAALYDPQYMNRQVTLGGLQTLGITQIEPVARISDLETAIAGGAVELIIAELQNGEDSVCELVRRVRHRLIGNNPFVVILLTTWDLNAEAVRAVLNSGADDLLARPYTIAQLQQRLSAAVYSRKPFVVTADYVGPSRRESRQDPEEGELFDVPNPFRERALQVDARAAQDIEAAWRSVLRWKAIRLGRLLETAATQLAKSALPSGDESAIGALTSRIAHTAVELEAYAREASSPIYDSIADSCGEIAKATRAPPQGEPQIRQFIEFATLVSDQIRAAATADRNGSAAGAVPFYVG